MCSVLRACWASWAIADIIKRLGTGLRAAAPKQMLHFEVKWEVPPFSMCRMCCSLLV